MKLYRQPGSKVWTADFIVDGRRYRTSTKQTTQGKALEVAAEFLRQAKDEEAAIDLDPVNPDEGKFLVASLRLSDSKPKK